MKRYFLAFANRIDSDQFAQQHLLVKNFPLMSLHILSKDTGGGDWVGGRRGGDVEIDR